MEALGVQLDIKAGSNPASQLRVCFGRLALFIQSNCLTNGFESRHGHFQKQGENKMDYCTFRFEDGICDLPPEHGGNHIVDGQEIIVAYPLFDDYADEYDLTPDERSALFEYYFKRTTGEE